MTRRSKNDGPALAIFAAYEAGDRDYVSTVQDLLADCTSRTERDAPIDLLLTMLGCHSTRHVGGDELFRLCEPAQPLNAHEMFVTKTLLATLRLHIGGTAGGSANNGPAILDGLARHERWRACLETVAAANDFAALILAEGPLTSTLPMDPTPWGKFLIESAQSLYAILNVWLTPGTAFSTETPLPVVACAMFGEPWYALTFGGEYWFNWPMNNKYSDENRAIAESVIRNPPPFLPNRLGPGVGDQPWMALPELSP